MYQFQSRHINMDIQEQRSAVITEAMSWLRTPHHNHACIKGAGVDCGQFPIAVYEAAGVIPHIDVPPYPPDFHLHSGREWYLGIVEQFGRELPSDAIPKKGDFVLYKIGRVFSHGAIVIEWPTIIHAYVGQGVVIADGTQGHLGSVSARKFFTPKGW